MRRSTGIVVGALLLSLALASCSSSADRAPKPTTAPTPIARLDATAVRIARLEFCDRMPAAAVRAALGAKTQADDSWGNGDPAPTDASSPGRTDGDVTHELGCAWTGSTGAAARAWVFARPLTAEFAQTLVTQAADQQGCTAEAATTFGRPALLQTCPLPGGIERIRRAGLFGDSWLTCEVAGPSSPDLRSRTDDWCAAVVGAARASD